MKKELKRIIFLTLLSILIFTVLGILAYKISPKVYKATAVLEFLGGNNLSSSELLINKPKTFIRSQEAAFLIRKISTELKNRDKYKNANIHLLVGDTKEYPIKLTVYSYNKQAATNFLNDLLKELNENEYTQNLLNSYKNQLTSLSKEYKKILIEIQQLYKSSTPKEKVHYADILFKLKNSQLILNSEFQSQMGFTYMWEPDPANRGRPVAPSLPLYLFVSEIVAFFAVAVLVIVQLKNKGYIKVI